MLFMVLTLISYIYNENTSNILSVILCFLFILQWHASPTSGSLSIFLSENIPRFVNNNL